MKAYFTASIVGKKYHIGHYLKIIEFLKKGGYDVIADHILKVEEKDINLQSKQQRLNFHKKLVSWITSSDIMVVEGTFPSISVGYEISIALHHNKPVLVLYSEGDPPSLLAVHQNEKLICEKYTDETLEAIIQDFLIFASESSDMRFTFFLTSEQANYLDDTSRKHKVPKSVYLRSLLEMDKKHHEAD